MFALLFWPCFNCLAKRYFFSCQINLRLEMFFVRVEGLFGDFCAFWLLTCLLTSPTTSQQSGSQCLIARMCWIYIEYDWHKLICMKFLHMFHQWGDGFFLNNDTKWDIYSLENELKCSLFKSIKSCKRYNAMLLLDRDHFKDFGYCWLNVSVIMVNFTVTVGLLKRNAAFWLFRSVMQIFTASTAIR